MLHRVMTRIAAVLLTVACSASADPGARMGSGNINRNIEQAGQRFEILNRVGAGMCRITVSENEYYPKDGKPRPEAFDEVILLARKHGIEPMILFEYYTKWNGPLGGRDKWRTVGRAFAERFAPNSVWLKSKGISDWGVRYYSAINEPMWKDNNPTPIQPQEYAKALEGLADGVHSVDDKLHVSPGGYQEIPLLRSNPYGPAVAHLYNSGKLSCIDIHRYYDIQHQPMYGTYRNSLQNQFDEVKKKWGITADIGFCTTEFNFKKRQVSEEEAAAGFLTAIWDALGVVGNQGQPVTRFALPWNIFHLAERDDHYGMVRVLDPWQPTQRGQTLKIVLQLTDGMEFTSLDPRQSGVFTLAGNGQKMWVWQNRKGWTDKPGESFTLTDVPRDVKQVEVFGWEGLRKIIPTNGKTQVTVEGLAPEQTYMFVANRKSPMPESLSSQVTEQPRSGPSWDFSHGPLRISGNRRFLQHKDGAPFFWLGDTAWELFHRLNREEADKYLDVRRKQGYTVIQAVALAELDGLNTPNPYGDKPLIDNDPGRPNDEYFRHVDFIVDRAADKGLYIGMLPTWGDKVTKAWGVGPVVYTEENAYAYGKFLGQRYKDRPNIIWILGGDRVADDKEDLWRAMVKGIDDSGDTHLKTYHPQGGRSSEEWFHNDDWLDFNMLQSGHGEWFNPNWQRIGRDYGRTPVKPCLDGEPCYEDHPVSWKPANGWFNDIDVRQAAYWAVFAGAFGHTYGCHDIWQMHQKGRDPISSARNNWYDVLELPGAWDMLHLRRLMLSRPFFDRIPDPSLVAAGQGQGVDHIQATRGKNYAFLYMPTGKQVTVQMGRISGDKVAAWWFNPRTGEAIRIGEFDNTGTKTFDPPDRPHRGNDWILVLDDAGESFAAPGRPDSL